MLWTAVSVTHREPHIIQAEKKQTSSLSPHPTRVFYFIAGQQTVILFSRKGWKIAVQFCMALLPPWAMAQTKAAPECPGGTEGVYPVQEHRGRRTQGKSTKPHSNAKFVSACPSTIWRFFYLRANFPFSFIPICVAVPEYSKSLPFLGGCIISFNILCSLIMLQSSPVIYCP